jgi:hypothetical protein
MEDDEDGGVVPTTTTPTAGPLALPLHEPDRLLDDLSKEYYAVVGIVSGFDQRLMTIKGWSVTISLAALGFGFSRSHYALFGVAAVTGVVFWIIDILTKRHQLRYYPRMWDIEEAAAELNKVTIDGKDLYAPRVGWTWSVPGGRSQDLRNDQKIGEVLRRVPVMGNVLLPHIVAIVLGILLCIGVAINFPDGMNTLQL